MGNHLNPPEHNDSVSGRTSQELPIAGQLLHFTRHTATVHIHDPATRLHPSDVLPEITIHSGGLRAYRGPATVSGLVHSGSHLLCELALQPTALTPAFLDTLPNPNPHAHPAHFSNELEQRLRIRPDFKLAVADVQSTLLALQRWTQHLELSQAQNPADHAAAWLDQTVQSVHPAVITLLNRVFTDYETAAAQIPKEDLPAHRAHVQRCLHPLVLCAPFAHRTYFKPLGYPGDFQMVNMMLANPSQGPTLYARLLNAWLLHQDSAAAHRNRIAWLHDRLVHTAAQAARQNRRARVYNIGCGPCHEIRRFLELSPLSSHVDFVLADFDSLAIDHARQTLLSLTRQHLRRTLFDFQLRSIRDILRDSLAHSRCLDPQHPFDLVYCAGLFDYLTDTACRQFVSLGCRSVRPGGTFICTNVAPQNPNRYSMELILDWHLFYRNTTQMRSLVPPDLTSSSPHIETELTGSNIFLEITPEDAR